MKKRFIVSLSAVLVAAVFSLIFVSSISQVNTNTVEYTKSHRLTIVIDAGHGGEDGGAVSGNILEKNINLDISIKLRDIFVANGFDVQMTRNTDISIYDDNATTTLASKKRSDLNNRVKIFNSSPDNIIISIHQNNFSQSKYSGTQIFYSVNNENSSYLADFIKRSVIELLQPDNTRQSKPANNDIYILKNCNNPAILIECGFMSNQDELSKLCDNDYQNKMAYSIWLGFMEYYYTTYF